MNRANERKPLARQSQEYTSLEKGLVLLSRLATNDGSMTLGDLAHISGFNRSTVYRLCEALVSQGWLQEVPDSGGVRESRRVGLGPTFLGLAVLVGNKFDIHDRLQPIIDTLSRTIGETVHLGILTDDEVVHVAIGLPDQGPHLAVQLGARSLAHTTALGKAMLSTCSAEAFELRYPVEELESRTPRTIRTRSALRRDLEEVRRRGYAIDDEESRLGVRCLAFPIFGVAGEAVAAISVTTTPARLTGEHAELVVRSLREAAVRATEALGGGTGTDDRLSELPARSARYATRTR